MTQPTQTDTSRTHRLLLLIAGLQAVLIVCQFAGGIAPRTAEAADPFPNTLAQREQMIAELAAIHQTVKDLRQRLDDRPLQVRVESDDAQ